MNNRILLVITLLAMLPCFALASSKFDLFKFTIESRGMIVYWAAAIILIAMPLLNKHLKVIGIYALLLTLSRGLMRLTDEQDPLRAWLSMETGFKIGASVSIALVAAAIVWLVIEVVINQTGLARRLSDEEVREIAFHSLLRSENEASLLLSLQDKGFREKECKRILEEYRKLAQKNAAA